MDNDNVYQNDGATFFANSDAVEEAINQEVADVYAEFPLLQAHINYLDERIAYFSSIDSIAIDLEKDAEGHRRQIAVSKLMKGELLTLRGDIETRVDAAKKRR